MTLHITAKTLHRPWFVIEIPAAMTVNQTQSVWTLVYILLVEVQIGSTSQIMFKLGQDV